MQGSAMQEGRTYRVLAALTMASEPLSPTASETCQTKTWRILFPTVTIVEIRTGSGPITWYRAQLKYGIEGWLCSKEVALTDVLDVTEDQP